MPEEIKHFTYPSTGVGHYGKVIDSKEGFDVIECETCRFKHVIPIPMPEKLADYYKTEFVGKRPNLIERWEMVCAGKI